MYSYNKSSKRRPKLLLQKGCTHLTFLFFFQKMSITINLIFLLEGKVTFPGTNNKQRCRAGSDPWENTGSDRPARPDLDLTHEKQPGFDLMNSLLMFFSLSKYYRIKLFKILQNYWWIFLVLLVQTKKGSRSEHFKIWIQDSGNMTLHLDLCNKKFR